MKKEPFKPAKLADLYPRLKRVKKGAKLALLKEAQSFCNQFAEGLLAGTSLFKPPRNTRTRRRWK